ncbi:polyribonucleotide nucleotidyltransferase [Leptospirillum ferriphilum]|jgi:polyribonucleotide nucleotidyltransferase|uniref:Polyribonucleotide nucleotidyltransferase n=3 Tax=Leptospirillum ferriphilum TaxID=178606 RepID=A0A059XYQ4_9BACT|nr:polyribonucleotide nucleotidyltransferase [Leptospirillum ferriphilum]AFS53292.1 putative polyribonucleotide nucleotidyltransferase [Leptospirillum ferriphilum ML-04]AIA30342.1 polynucleotide phosphorylase/polyadenylase [Leptospirillum ferriphilum YSK]MCL5259075.1 polyribonucleotide nucleotidyltransferase [Nitrospirota bacterium]OOH75121.1 polyribonucleotide nucleotidyltransferase [Leptospirillum ferriphilum]
MNPIFVEAVVGGKTVRLETGRMAKQADGSVVVWADGTVVIATAVASKVSKPGVDFLPLTVDYQERAYAAGKIPGGFFKREGKPSEREILNSRLIDRPLRPLFPEGFFFDTQLIASVISIDRGGISDVMAVVASSAALYVSDIPFMNPVAAVKVGCVDGTFIVNPTLDEQERSTLDLVVAGTRDAIMMVEGQGNEISEETFLSAIDLAHKSILPLIEAQEKLRAMAGKEKRPLPAVPIPPKVMDMVESMGAPRLREALKIAVKQERQEQTAQILGDVREKILQEFSASSPEMVVEEREIFNAFHELERRIMREMILDHKVRADGRGLSDIRPITIEVGILPRTHGSALFTRGETQSLSVATLGTSDDEQRIDALEGESTKRFMLHYNFPPFSVGETKPMRGPGRREIGHGNLAERALKPVLPARDSFPYSIRLVSDILESNGSSSMATVCGGSLAMMDAGIPIKSAVAGIAMGLIKEGDRIAILSDILGLEDHLGDMDFKVTGTENGITAVQMDIKITGITVELMREALQKAREGRLYIMEKMKMALPSSRNNMSPFAPRILTLKIKQDKIREVIGPGGKVIRGITEKTGAKIEIDDSGLIQIASTDEVAAQKAIDMINQIVEEVQVGKIYLGRVKTVADYGAFVELFPGTTGLCHISQLEDRRVEKVSDVVSEGDLILVKALEVDRQGKIRLSRKEAIAEVGADREVRVGSGR